VRARCGAFCRGAGPEGGGTSKDYYRFGVDFATARADFAERYLDCVAHLQSCAGAILNLDDRCMKRAAAEAPATECSSSACARQCNESEHVARAATRQGFVPDIFTVA
jgi:hypothetical protein